MGPEEPESSELLQLLLESSELDLGGDLLFFNFHVLRLSWGEESLSSFLINFVLADSDLDFKGDFPDDGSKPSPTDLMFEHSGSFLWWSG